MSECQECDDGQIRKIETPYGIKEVCDTCGYVAKDVDTYAGVMVWSHKTAPEIEIHASKASAAAVLDSNRVRVVRNPVRVVHHAPQEMGGRRQNTGKVEPEVRISNCRPTHQRVSGPDQQRSITIPAPLRQHVQDMVKGNPEKMRTYTKFTVDEVNRVMAVLPHTSSLDDLSRALGQRFGKNNKATGILSWLSVFGHTKPPTNVTVWQGDDCLVLKSESSFESMPTYDSLDFETRRSLGYTLGSSRYI
jgi:hypothetical protein